jgi:hypothetical protein
MPYIYTSRLSPTNFALRPTAVRHVYPVPCISTDTFGISEVMPRNLTICLVYARYVARTRTMWRLMVFGRSLGLARVALQTHLTPDSRKQGPVDGLLTALRGDSGVAFIAPQLHCRSLSLLHTRLLPDGNAHRHRRCSCNSVCRTMVALLSSFHV